VDDAVVVSQQDVVMGYVFEFALYAATPDELKAWYRQIQSAIATTISEEKSA
jgi:hypothetical protein